MPRQVAVKLTEARISRLPAAPQGERTESPDALAPGLIMRVNAKGRKDWQVRYRLHGRSYRLGLGAWPVVTLAEARRITVDTTRIASESFPMAVPPEEAERRCRRALMEAWVGRETAAFRLAPSRLALDPADVLSFVDDGRAVPLRLVSIADAEARGIEAVRQDRDAYDLPPGAPRPSALSQAVVFGAPEAVLLDLPQLTEDQPAHRPFAVAHAVPWPGEIAVFRSPSTDGFELLTTFGTRARIGTLVSDFYAGPTSRFDLGNVLVVDLLTGTL